MQGGADAAECFRFEQKHPYLRLQIITILNPRTKTRRVSTAVRSWLKTSGLKLRRRHTSPSIS
jgi:hypothetical protein